MADERPELVECCDRYTLNDLGALLRREWLMDPGYRAAGVGLHCERIDEIMAAYVSRRKAEGFCRCTCGGSSSPCSITIWRPAFFSTARRSIHLDEIEGVVG